MSLENINGISTNLHHGLYMRRTHSRGISSELREHPIMKHQLPLNIHNELHAQTPPVRRLNPELVHGSLNYLGAAEYAPVSSEDKLERLDDYSEWLRARSHWMGKFAMSAGELHESLDRQSFYIRAGNKAIELAGELIDDDWEQLILDIDNGYSYE